MIQTFNLTVFHTSDTHGHLTSDSYSNQKQLPKGLARIAHFFKTQHQENQIKIDLGDTIQGGPLAFIYHDMPSLSTNPFAATLNHLGYDYFIPGNHDFNYGLPYLKEFIKKLDATVLCGNVFINNSLYFKAAYHIQTFQSGPKIAIIGLTNNYIPNWEAAKNIEGLDFERADTSAQRLIEKIKKEEQPDFIIVAYHGGYECDLETGDSIAKNDGENLGCAIFTQLKDVDLLLTGHEHRSLVLLQDQRIMLQPGYAGEYVSQTDIEFVLQNGKWKIQKTQGKLNNMANYEDDKELLDLLAPFIDQASHKLNQVIGYTQQNLLIDDPLKARIEKHPIFEYINTVQMKATGAMISCCSLGNEVYGFDKEIKVSDVLNTYIFPNTLSLCQINGKDLKKALQHNAQFFAIQEDNSIGFSPQFLYPKKELYNYDVFDGICYEYHLYKNQPNKVKNITYKNQAVQDSDTFTIAINSYRLSGGGNIDWHQNLEIIQHFPLDITEILIQDVQAKKNIQVHSRPTIRIIQHD